jgi:hypothetical protein
VFDFVFGAYDGFSDGDIFRLLGAGESVPCGKALPWGPGWVLGQTDEVWLGTADKLQGSGSSFSDSTLSPGQEDV